MESINMVFILVPYGLYGYYIVSNISKDFEVEENWTSSRNSKKARVPGKDRGRYIEARS